MKLKTQSLVPQRGRHGFVDIFNTQVPHPIALFAQDLIARWGMVACKIAINEDSAGRQKLELLTPEEVVDRARKTAEIAFEQFAHKDWLCDVPLPEQSEPQDKAK